MIRKSLGIAVACAFLSPAAMAASIGFGYNAGEVVSIADSASTGAFDGFVIGEDVFVEFTIDSATTDAEPIVGDGNFDDPTGTIKITGLTSSTMLSMVAGVEIEFDDQNEFELETLGDPTDDTGTGYYLGNDIDLDSGGLLSLISDPDSLGPSITELEALLSGNSFSGFANATTNTALVRFYVPGDGLTEATAIMEVGPVPTVNAPVPVPAAGLVLVTGLAGLGTLRRFRRNAAA